jgi:hypothetical protein
LEANLPISWQRIFPFVRILRPQWVFREKHAIFEKYGDVFAIVTPAGCEIYIADSKAASQILMRKKDFPKPLDFASKQNVEPCRLSRGGNMVARKTSNIWEKLSYCMLPHPAEDRSFTCEID